MTKIKYSISKKLSLLPLLFLFVYCFFTGKIVFADNSDIVINEIGAFETSDNEWIEIYNKGSTAIDLTGWKFYENETNHSLNAFQGDLIIEPNEYAIIANKADKFISKYSFTGTVIDSSWSNLNESGEPIALKDSTGTIIESFTYLSAPNHSLERANPNLADYTSSNWQEHPSGHTAGSQNSNFNSGTSGTPPQPPSSSPSSALAFGDVLINEFVSDPADGEEWIELYNKTNEEIDLAGWTIEEGSESITNLSGKIGNNGTSRFFIVEKPKGNLNNSGDIIILKGSNGLIIDQVAYGNWNDGNLEDNAPKASDPNSIARLADGFNTFNNANDFRVTSIVTKGNSNIISNEENSQIQFPNQVYSKEIILNEFLPNPTGDDRKAEWIELKNIGTIALDLASWKLSDNKSTYIIKKEDFPTTLINGQGFFVLPRQITGIALNNTGGEALKLYNPDGQLMETIEYKEAAKENQSYARDKEQWFWTVTPTPGEENIITIPNQPPQAIIDAKTEGVIGEEIKFDASDSTDPDGEILTYSWDFGDGEKSDLINPSHSYKKAGVYKITLKVKDSQGTEDKQIINLTIKENTSNVDFKTEPVKESGNNFWGQIIINEFLPNPKGPDEEEWIELKNLSQEEIDLSDWQIDDGKGGSHSYSIPKGTIIKPNEFLLFNRQKTKIALNNTSDSVRLFNNLGGLISEVSYQGAKEGFAFALNKNGVWEWTETPTPGEENIISNPPQPSQNKNQKAKGLSQNIIETTLEKIREQDLGDKVKVKGKVAVEPGILGKTIFYLAGSGIQVYYSKKDWPNLKLGDLVELTGILSQSGEETRIKLADKNDIKILKHELPPEPKEIKDEEIDEELEGYLIKIQGEVLGQKGQTIYLDSGNQEIPIYIKSTTNIPKLNFKEGTRLSVIGIVSQTKSGYRILPRYPEDIEILSNQNEKDKISLLGENKTKNEVIKYLIATAGTLMFVLVGLMVKNRNYIKKYFRGKKS